MNPLVVCMAWHHDSRQNLNTHSFVTNCGVPTVDFHRDDPGRMLEMLGEEEIGLTAIDRLNELLEAERAGVDALSRLFPEARSPEMQKLFEEVRNHEAWSWREHLEEMKTRHVTNIEACEQLAESLKAA